MDTLRRWRYSLHHGTRADDRTAGRRGRDGRLIQSAGYRVTPAALEYRVVADCSPGARLPRPVVEDHLVIDDVGQPSFQARSQDHNEICLERQKVRNEGFAAKAGSLVHRSTSTTTVPAAGRPWFPRLAPPLTVRLGPAVPPHRIGEHRQRDWRPATQRDHSNASSRPSSTRNAEYALVGYQVQVSPVAPISAISACSRRRPRSMPASVRRGACLCRRVPFGYC
jgi:hypothetical protein